MPLEGVWKVLELSVGSEFLVRVVTAVVVLAVFLAAGHYMPSWLLSRLKHVETGFIQKIGTTISIFLYVIGIVAALSVLSLSYAVIEIIFVLVVIGLLIAFRDALANAVGEVYIRLRTPFSEGEWVKIGDLEGRVASINTFDVELVTPHGERILVPNSLFLRGILVKKPGMAGSIVEAYFSLRGVTIEEARKALKETLKTIRPELSGEPKLRNVERENDYVRVTVMLPLLNVLKAKQLVNRAVIQLRRKGYEAEAL